MNDASTQASSAAGPGSDGSGPEPARAPGVDPSELAQTAAGFVLARQRRASAADDRAWHVASDIEDEQALHLAAESGEAQAIPVKLAAMIPALLRAWSLEGAPANGFEILALASSALADAVLLTDPAIRRGGG